MNKIIQQIIQMSTADKLAYIGTVILFAAPYLLSYQIGFILAGVGVVLLIPQVWVKKQWNLVVLNFSSAFGYLLQILNVI